MGGPSIYSIHATLCRHPLLARGAGALQNKKYQTLPNFKEKVSFFLWARGVELPSIELAIRVFYPLSFHLRVFFPFYFLFISSRIRLHVGRRMRKKNLVHAGQFFQLVSVPTRRHSGCVCVCLCYANGFLCVDACVHLEKVDLHLYCILVNNSVSKVSLFNW